MSGNSMIIDQRTVYLFGINVPVGNPKQAAKARQALDGLLSEGPVRCEVHRSWLRGVLAICSANDGSDLAISLLRLGVVTVLPSQALVSPWKDSYFAAEDVARAAGKGVWEPEDKPSSSIEQALDKVALALATPPNPVPSNSWLWSFHPWQSAIAGLFGLIGAAFVLVAAKHTTKNQSAIIDKQFNDQKTERKRERIEKSIGLFYSIKREVKVLRRSAGVISYTIDEFNIEESSDNKLKIGAEQVFVTYREKYSLVCPKKLLIDPADLPIIGLNIGARIESIVDRVDYYEEWYGRACMLYSDNWNGERCKKNMKIANKRSKDIFNEIELFLKHLNAAIDRAKKEIASLD